MTTIIRNPSACCGSPKRIRGTVVDPGSGFVPISAATFQITGLSWVYGSSTLPTAPLTLNQIYPQGYVAGQETEAQYNETTGEWDNLPAPIKLGCHLNVTSNGFIYVTPQTLAGSGLSYSTGTGPGGCDQLMATGSGTYAEGYCIEIEDLETDKIHVDQITTAAGVRAIDIDTTEQQFWVHFSGASARTDAKWKSADNYSTSGSAFQFLINEADTWKWKDITGYDPGVTQLLGHVSGSWQLKTIAEWLKLLTGYVHGNDQTLVHLAGADPTWKDLDQQIFALNASDPCDLAIDDNQLVLTLHGKLLKVFAVLDQDNVDKTCELGAVVCGEVV